MDGEIERCIRSEYGRLVGVVAIVTGTTSSAEDAVQEAFARAWERSQQGQCFEHLAGWVVTVALNHARTGHRRRQAEEGAMARMPGSSVAIDGGTSEIDVRMVIGQAVDGLAGRQRDAVVLYYLLDIDVVTVARLLDVSEGTVKTALSRARTHLASLLGDEPVEA